jgi:hypothetical protein
MGVYFFSHKYSSAGVYTGGDRVRPRASGWVGVRAHARGHA